MEETARKKEWQQLDDWRVLHEDRVLVATGSALALGERVKTTECCFCEAKSTKQVVKGELYVRRITTMRLDRGESQDGAGKQFKFKIKFLKLKNGM